jgi:hypothetical protein
VNDTYKELKERMRKLDEFLTLRGQGNTELAQAVSQLHRAARKGDRSREPSPELRGLLEKAEGIARRITA